MTFQNAKKLHNGDEVTLKANGAVTTVISVTVTGKLVLIECAYDGITTFTHKEVE